MEIIAIIELAVSALGLSADVAKSIKERSAKKISVTPNIVETTARHWDSTNSVIIQNIANKPLFSVQIAFWHDHNQKLDIKLDAVKKEARIKDLIIDYGVVQYRGFAKNEEIVLIEILRLMPNESLEIDLQIQKPGSVKILPVSYDEKQSKQVLTNTNDFAYPFSPPFEMSLSSMSLRLKRDVDAVHD